MKRKICFSTGNIWRWNPDRTKLTDYVMKLDVDGIELSFNGVDGLRNFNQNKKQIAWLRKTHVSMHAPARSVDLRREKEMVELLCEKYKEYGAENVVIHHTHLPSVNWMKKVNMKYCVENLTPIAGFNSRKLSRVLQKYKNAGVCLDASHAYLWSPSETRKMVDKFGKKIFQVHLSGTYRGKEHGSLRKVSQRFLKSIKPLRELDCPIIIEEDMRVKSLRYAQREIDWVREFFE